MRTPLQGGLPLVDTVAGAVVEIACDESGFSGANLLDPASPLITLRKCRPVHRRSGRAEHGAAVPVPTLAKRVQVRAVPPQPGSGRGPGVVPGGAARPGPRPSGRQGVLPRHSHRRPATGRAVVRGRYPPDPGPASGRPLPVPGQALGWSPLARLPRRLRRAGSDQTTASA